MTRIEDRLKFDEWFLDKKHKEDILIGTELELLLFDSRNKEPLQNMGLVERILDTLHSKELTKNIYRDHYPYQLEIRTLPHNNPTDLIKETKLLYSLASKEFLKHDIYVIPIPAITKEGYVYCGMHTHINYPNEKDVRTYYERAMGMYPFILSLSDHTKNFEISEFNGSDRIDKSHHIGLPYLKRESFLGGSPGDHKYKDVILSNSISSDSNRSRMKKPHTIEVRMLDTPSLLSFYEFMTHYVYNIASHIRVDNPIVNMLDNDMTETHHKLALTRNLLVRQRYGVNKIFRMLNADVCELVSNHFGMDFPNQTQFEFRESEGLSANTNGFLSMAIKGGWL